MSQNIESTEEQIANDLRDKFVGWEDETIDPFNYEYRTSTGDVVFLTGKIRRPEDGNDTLLIEGVETYTKDGEEVRSYVKIHQIE